MENTAKLDISYFLETLISNKKCDNLILWTPWGEDSLDQPH